MGFNHVENVADLVPLRRVLVAVYDKTNLREFIAALASAAPVDCPLEIFSTGGSYRLLADAFPESADEDAAGSACRHGFAPFFRLRTVSDYTRQPEMKGGLVKTMDWKIYLGLLAEPGDESHSADLTRTASLTFDMVVGNFYPFEAAVREGMQDVEALRQRVDIGGPSMIRAAAKNFLRVAAVSSPSQYGPIAVSIKEAGGCTRLVERKRLAAAAFSLTARFDAVVAERLSAIPDGALSKAYRVR